MVNDSADMGSSYYRPFKQYGEPSNNIEDVKNNPQDFTLAVFTGGEDVDPSYYGKKKNHRTYSNIYRDREEKELFDVLLEHKIPLFGICRGSQFLCVMAGGSLCQHLDNHGGGGGHMMTNQAKDMIK
jgi:putative glutamine amidotransferase